MADTSLNSAIADAAAELAAKAGTPVPEELQNENTGEEVSAEEVGEGTGEESSEDATLEDLSESELIESKNLYKALKDPTSAAAVIAALAQQAGLLPKPGDAPPTKKETVEAKKEIREILAEALGKEYGFLAERLGPGIDAILKQEREASESRFAEIQQSNVEREVVTAYENLSKETKGESKKFETRMAQLSEEIPIGNMNVKTYMQRLYTIASNERKSSPQKVADQIRRNAADAPARLRTGAAPMSQEGIKIPDKKMSLDESIKFAQAQLAAQKR